MFSLNFPDKSLVDANRRQCIELQAQNATLEEQRIHINVLDTALKRLEEEVWWFFLSDIWYTKSRYSSVYSAVKSRSTWNAVHNYSMHCSHSRMPVNEENKRNESSVWTTRMIYQIEAVVAPTAKPTTSSGSCGRRTHR